ncbi:hypothetical protein D9M68_461490 [compost metagenome]
MGRVFDEQCIDVDDVTLDQQVIGALAQLDQGARDDVDEAPGELAKGGTVAFAGELAGDTRGDFGDATEAPHGVVARRDVRPAEVEEIELALTAGTLGLDIHPLEQVGIAFGIEDDHRLILAGGIAAPNVLGNEQLGQPRFTDPRRAQDQGLTDALAQRQVDVELMGFDTVQPGQAAHRRQRPHRVEGDVPGGELGQVRQRKRSELQSCFQAAR